MSTIEARDISGEIAGLREALARAEDRAVAFQTALGRIKDLCAGDRVPNWKDDFATTNSRGRILDIIDLTIHHHAR